MRVLSAILELAGKKLRTHQVPQQAREEVLRTFGTELVRDLPGQGENQK